jgi:hypothetical protein
VSDDWLQLIPLAPAHVPDAAVAERARVRFAAMVGPADEVLVTVTDTVAFIDSGANHERIGCPACGMQLDEGWWVRALDTAGESGFTDLHVTVPCCRRRLSLNDLVYDWPAGFARFVLEAMNPAVDDLGIEELEELSALLDTPLRVIRTHI